MTGITTTIRLMILKTSPSVRSVFLRGLSLSRDHPQSSHWHKEKTVSTKKKQHTHILFHLHLHLHLHLHPHPRPRSNPLPPSSLLSQRIMESILRKRSGSFPHHFHNRFFRLRGSRLQWFSSRNSVDAIGTVDLLKCRDIRQKDGIFEVETSDRKLILKAKNDKLKRAWIQQLEVWNNARSGLSEIDIPASTCEAICVCRKYVSNIGA